jgi:hypothetical protein
MWTPEDFANDEEMMFPKSASMGDTRISKQIEKSLTGKSISKVARSRLLQMMAMNAARKQSSGGFQNG